MQNNQSRNWPLLLLSTALTIAVTLNFIFALAWKRGVENQLALSEALYRYQHPGGASSPSR